MKADCYLKNNRWTIKLVSETGEDVEFLKGWLCAQPEVEVRAHYVQEYKNWAITLTREM